MDLILQQNLPHQQAAVDAVCAALHDVSIEPPRKYYRNPTIDVNDPLISENIRGLQENLPADFRTFVPNEKYLNLDVKMETGTGKTYVYSKIMFEMFKQYGINKFIIAVPSLAIKSGTAQFLQDPYVRRHFKDSCGYGTDLEVCVLEAQKKKKKGRQVFPSEIRDFVTGSNRNTNKIYVLIVNMQLLVVRSDGMLSRNDYDYEVAGHYRPLDALRDTKPVIIIDEPHRFSRDQKAFGVIEKEIKPQMIIRFGATFPQKTIGRGKNKTEIKDYDHLLYDLNAAKSFAQGLIKGVAKEHFPSPSGRDEKVKIKVNAKDSVDLRLVKAGEPSRTYNLKVGDSLASVSDAFTGISVINVGTSTVEFSNGQEKKSGEEMDVNIYMDSYQEGMLRLALQRHFETERQNFDRRFKIKTLALFFIDDIASYRKTDENTPQLVETFERLLKEEVERTLNKLNNNETEYRQFLEATIADIPACHAGYFSRDNSDSDEAIAQEVDEILHGKKQLLSFKKEDGSYNTRRFLFSKWTLKEGWDNPNVFTIAKLRSSGSDISKLQEVGRGLRLPVDENGNRIDNEAFELNYIVDFTEKDFADQLVDEINREIPRASVITEQQIQDVAKKLNVDPNNLLIQLLSKQYIDFQRNINPEKRNQFFAEYPAFASGISIGERITDRNRQAQRTVQIRKTQYSELKELWEKINQRYYLFYDRTLNQNLKDVIVDLLNTQSIFTSSILTSQRSRVRSEDGHMVADVATGVSYEIDKHLPYNEFLKRIMRATNIPITEMHDALCMYAQTHGAIEDKFFSEKTVAAFCAAFQDWKSEHLHGRFNYKKANLLVGETKLSNADGSPKETISQGYIGVKFKEGTPAAKYLYDTYAFDSTLEERNISTEFDSIVVYGKIPKKSIAIPTIAGETYSPDFMYVVRKADGTKELNVIIETKDVEGKTDLRGVEKVKIDCAKIFFDMLSSEEFPVFFRDQLNNKEALNIIKEVLR